MKAIHVQNMLLVLVVAICMFGVYICDNWNEKHLKALEQRPLVDLPEEIEQVTPKDTMRCYWTGDGKLHVEFNNKRNHEKH